MSFTPTLLVYGIVAILVFVLARLYNIRIFSALILALVIAQIAISIFRPGNPNVGMAMDAYLIIQVITSLLVLVYVFGKALSDRG